MNIGRISSATEAYSNSYINRINEKPDAGNELKLQNKQNEEKQTSFSKEAAELSISEAGKKIANDNQSVIHESEDGRVVSKAKTEVQAAEKVAGQNADNTEKIENLTGYSSSQVETLYRQGKVDRIDYEQKMEKLEELKESVTNQDKASEVKAEENKVSENKVSENKATEKKVSENKVAENKVASQNAEKLQKNKTEEKDDDKAKDNVKEAIESNREQSKEFGKILLKEEDVANKDAAFEKALENDRVELIKPLFEDKAREMQISAGNV